MKAFLRGWAVAQVVCVLPYFAVVGVSWKTSLGACVLLFGVALDTQILTWLEERDL